MVKGVGVDCGLLPYAVYRKFDLIPAAEFEWLPDDWWCHASEERYLLMIERYLRRLIQGQMRREATPECLPGNLVLTRVCGSRLFNHAGIITSWPRVVQAIPECRVSEIDAAHDSFWIAREIVIFDIGLKE